jgi:3,4-dihydroxy 2-butanone 4-phosphate synthase/GTP cyclohydrolase II
MKRQEAVVIPTKWGNFTMIAYASRPDDAMPQFAFVHESFIPASSPVVRIHSECFTGDVLGSRRCDCGEQLDQAMSIAADQGGVVIYLRQEGRGIGIINKMKTYHLQDQGLDTIAANIHLGFEADERTYEMAVAILQDLKITKLHIMTNNPIKVEALDNAGIEVLGVIPIVTQPTVDNKDYLEAKQKLSGHWL